MIAEPLRLDAAGAPDVRVPSTSAWVHRCAKRMLELDPELDPLAAMHTVDDMATSSRWRSMPPEAVAEMLFRDGAVSSPMPLAGRATREA